MAGALVAARILRELSHLETEAEEAASMKDLAMRFENLAIGVREVGVGRERGWSGICDCWEDYSRILLAGKLANFQVQKSAESFFF